MNFPPLFYYCDSHYKMPECDKALDDRFSFLEKERKKAEVADSGQNGEASGLKGTHNRKHSQWDGDKKDSLFVNVPETKGILQS